MEKKDNSANDPKSSNWTNQFGAILVIVLVALIVVMFWKTEGDFSQSHWAAFYIGVGLVTGLSFWIITGNAISAITGELGGMAIKLTGGAAVGAVFMILAKHLTPPSPPPSPVIPITHITISGDITRKTKIFVSDRDDLVGDLRTHGSHPYYIFIIEGQISHSALTVNIDDGISEEDCKRSGNEQCDFLVEIPKEQIVSYLNKKEDLEWYYDKNKRKLFDKKAENKELGKKVALINSNITNESSYYSKLTIFDFFISQANADPAEELNDLTSDELEIRRDARESLIERGINIINDTMSKLHESNEVYRIKLGTSYILAKIAGNNNDTNIIKSRLSDNDIQALVNLSNDADETIRLYATQFLVSIKDTRTATYCLNIIRNSTNNNGIYNAVLIIKSVFEILPVEEKSSTSQQLASLRANLGEHTNELIDTFIH